MAKSPLLHLNGVPICFVSQLENHRGGRLSNGSLAQTLVVLIVAGWGHQLKTG